jgi:hypothetical protein
MKLTLERDNENKDFASGRLYLDGQFFAYTLEPKEGMRIPKGNYIVGVSHSPSFSEKRKIKNYRLPVVFVKGRDGIRFHTGRKPTNSIGCILTGKKRISENEMVSDLALEKLLTSKLDEVNKKHSLVIKEAEKKNKLINLLFVGGGLLLLYNINN